MTSERHSPEHHALLVQDLDTKSCLWKNISELPLLPLDRIIAIGIFATFEQGHTHLVDLWCDEDWHHQLRQELAVDATKTLTATQLLLEANNLYTSLHSSHL